MSHHDSKKYSFTGVLLLLALSFAWMVHAENHHTDQVKRTNRIAVVSFQSLTSGEGNSVFCPICGRGSSSGNVLEGAERVVEEIFINQLSKREKIELIPSEQVQSVYQRISAGELKGTVTENLAKAGNMLGSDFIAVGYVYRYIERVGSKYSSEHPASVIFEIHLIKTDDGSIIWRGHFDKTQKSLMENIFDIASFFKSGAKWVTARQLTEQGMEQVLKTFPDF
jgi:TolB-like protein